MKQVPSDLTKRELVDLLEFVHRLLTVSTDEQFQNLLLHVPNLVPCENSVAGLGRIDSLARFQGFVKIVNISYPLDWVALYLKEGYAEVDPILRTHFERFSTQIWSDTFRRISSAREKCFVENAKSFGLSEGITLGGVCPRHGIRSLFSFAGREMADSGRHAALLEYLIPHLHIALMRTAFPLSGAPPLLSIREREVLEWMKEGKTSWEISQILRISERTVNFHVHNILSKLQASTRGHAIALAMQQGLIGA